MKSAYRLDNKRGYVRREQWRTPGVVVGCILLLWLNMALSPFCYATEKKAIISDIVVTNTRDDLLLYFTVKNCFTPSITKAIGAGIPTTFTFIAKLYETRRFVPDRLIADLSFRHEINYDELKKVYSIKLTEQDNRVVRVRDFRKAKKLMAEVVALRLTGLKNLHKGAHYQVTMKAELDKIRLPFHLHSILFFLSLWDFETDWYTLDFRY